MNIQQYIGKWIGVNFFISSVFGKNTPEAIIDNYLKDIVKGDYEKAFKYINYLDVSLDKPVAISEENAKKIWVSRVKALKDKGVYVKSFSDIKVFTFYQQEEQ